MLLRELVGPTIAKDLIFTARRIKCREAKGEAWQATAGMMSCPGSSQGQKTRRGLASGAAGSA